MGRTKTLIVVNPCFTWGYLKRVIGIFNELICTAILKQTVFQFLLLPIALFLETQVNRKGYGLHFTILKINVVFDLSLYVEPTIQDQTYTDSFSSPTCLTGSSFRVCFI